MNHISVNGVARQFGGQTGSFLVRLHLLKEKEVDSLRIRLEQMARCERSIEVKNCPGVGSDAMQMFVLATAARLIGGAIGGPILADLLTIYGGVHAYSSGFLIKWNAEFQQIWTHIVVRIKVIWLAENSDPDQKAQLLQLWKDEIEHCWSDCWACFDRGELSCPITFEVRWLEPGDGEEEHQILLVTDSIDRAAYFWWDDRHGAWPAVHEFGHIIGLADEYEENSYPCPGRDDPSDPIIHHGTLMAIGTDPSWVLVSVVAGTDPNGNEVMGTALTMEEATSNWRHDLNDNINALLPERYFTHFSKFIDSTLARV